MTPQQIENLVQKAFDLGKAKKRTPGFIGPDAWKPIANELIEAFAALTGPNNTKSAAITLGRKGGIGCSEKKKAALKASLKRRWEMYRIAQKENSAITPPTPS